MDVVPTWDRRSVLRLGSGAGLAVAAGLTTSGCGGDPVPDTAPPSAASTGGSPPAPTRHAYGADPSQFAELHRPAGRPRGTVVVIHGGFWRSQYDYTLGTPLATSLAQQGWAAWNLEYRRVGPPDQGGGGGDPATMDDVAAGIDALADLPADLAVPTSTVVALGHSAGGHLAAFAASRGRFAAWRPARVPLTHVVSQAGVLDLRAASDEGLGGGAVEAFLGHAPTDADDPVDPIRQVPLDVPVWCVHGDQDTIVPISQSQAYVAAATAAGARAKLVTVAGDHFVLIDPTSDAWTRTLAVLDTIAPR